MKKQPLCSIVELNQVFAFTMKDGEQFQSSGFNSFEAFTNVKDVSEWPNIADFEFLDGVSAPDGVSVPDAPQDGDTFRGLHRGVLRHVGSRN